jgi:uncharacterized phage-associated protein
MPYPAIYIANLFVKKAMSEGLPITQMKLQKIIYFAEGYHMAKYDKPLISEPFQAWKYGPVIPVIYEQYKEFGSRPIVADIDKFTLGSMSQETDLSKSAKDAMEYTWQVTRDISAEKLSAWTHLENSPWNKVYSDSDWSRRINEDDIKIYFKQMLRVTA